MSKKKLSLVLEGGGLRGAYTAGCLSWLIDEGIEFDGAYGISVGAVHLTSFLFKSKEFLYELSTQVLADKKYIGASAYLKAGQIVDYDSMFAYASKTYDYDASRLNTKTKGKIGLYDLGIGETIYRDVNNIDNEFLKTACSLPLLGKVGYFEGKEYLDGGITKMIPIEESIKDGYDKHLVITTKPLGFKRGPANSFVVWLMGVVYRKCKNISHDYEVRHLNYDSQISLINDLVKEGKAFYRYPTKEVKVSRLGGSKENLIELYNMGRSDMESSRKEIYELIK